MTINARSDLSGVNDDLDEMVEALSRQATSTDLRSLANSCKGLVKRLGAFHPIKLAATFGGLLTKKSLQANGLRLEALVHLSMAIGGGTRAATTDILVEGFAAVGSAWGHLEDPPEDIFVGNISSKRGNYLVLEGLWEGGTFYLQRLVNLVDGMPDVAYLSEVANAVHAMLRISQLVCARALLTRNEVGANQPARRLPMALAQESKRHRTLVEFSLEDLAAHGVALDHLRPFLFRPQLQASLLDEAITNSKLERRPLTVVDGTLYLVLPTAVSAAIRRYVLESLGTGQNRNLMLRKLSQEYTRQFEQTPFLGRSDGAFGFSHMSWGSVACVTTSVDVGRYLNFVLVLDTLEEFSLSGFARPFTGNPELLLEIEKMVAEVQASSREAEDFRGGLTLLVTCGIGRGAALQLRIEESLDWRIEHLSAPSFLTLSLARDMKPRDLWRILQMERELQAMGVHLQNMNGLLNLVAWSDSLHGHLVPHADIPVDANGQPLFISIQQNALLSLRHEVATSWDMHVEPFVDGSWRVVQAEGRALFKEDEKRRVYVSFETPPVTLPRGVCVTRTRAWWFEALASNGSHGTEIYERWKMLGTWCAKAVDHLEDTFSKTLPAGPVLWRCVFATGPQDFAPDVLGTADDATRAIKLNVDHAERTIELTVGEGFNHALFNADNIAESALVRAFLAGVALLAGSPGIDIDEVLCKVVPNTRARQSHAMFARTFRDFISSLRDCEPTFISRYDDASTKLGLGWRVRDQRAGGSIQGSLECISFLNKLVRHLEDELCSQLRGFNRRRALKKLLVNHEVASVSREYWHKTSAAVLALRNDQAAAMVPMREHELRLNSVFQASRILIEMAICEAGDQVGADLGEMDLAVLMAKSAQIYHLGGWSDLIRWGFMEPKLIVRPFGDVHANLEFIETVMQGFGNESSENRFFSSAQRYERNLQLPDVQANAVEHLGAAFLSAWSADFGVEFDAMRRFIDAVENHGIEHDQPIFAMSLSELAAMADDVKTGEKIVSFFSFPHRESWRMLPKGYEEKDISPWRFRRRLSVLRLPILDITGAENPEMLVTPGLLREGFAYTCGHYYKGSYADAHLGPAMRKYAGNARRRDGLEFNTNVAREMQRLGWKTASEVPLTKILSRSLDRNYGDVDVLAWNPASRRVLVMECKDLQFRKTYGEIAEQLSDFAGMETPDGKRDLMRKHLDRVDVLRSDVNALSGHLELQGQVKIEAYLVFSNTVPMQYLPQLKSFDCTMHTFAQLEELFKA